MSENKRSRILPFLGYAIPILLVVYVLSVGPVTAFFAKTPSGLPAAVDSFYAPIRWMVNESEFLGPHVGDLYVWYLVFCGVFGDDYGY